jgi:hypothetical protein
MPLSGRRRETWKTSSNDPAGKRKQGEDEDLTSDEINEIWKMGILIIGIPWLGAGFCFGWVAYQLTH